MSATPSSKSSRSPARIFSRIGASVSSLSRTATTSRLLLSVDYCVGQGLELVAMELSVEACPGLVSVVEGDLPSFVEGACGGDADERAVHRAAGERCAHGSVALRGEEQRQGRGADA